MPRTIYIYILANRNRRLYIGVTRNLIRRLFEHRNGIHSRFAHKYNIRRLVYWESANSPETAIAREKQLKGWRREKKIALIESMNPDWEDLSIGWTEGGVKQQAIRHRSLVAKVRLLGMTSHGGRIILMTDTLRFRWLGTAGIELESGGERILIDPYLSRFPLRFAVFGRPPPKRDLVVRSLSGARAVLVSHAHFDHLLDVSAVCREFGAVAYGSPNSCAILRAHGIPSEQVKTAKPGDVFSAGPFEIRILAGEHGRMLGLLPFAGKLPPRLSPPLRLSEYRMDSTFSFHIQASGKTALVWNSPESRDVPRADVLFYCPLWGVRNCAAAAAAAHSGIIVPIHWDDFFSPLDRPIRPLIAPPGWNSPWIRRMDPESFARSLKKILPGVKFLIPGVLKWFEINGNL